MIISLLSLSSCEKSNEERIIEEYLTSIQNEDGSVSKINLGKYTFHTFETLDIDGKFIYRLIESDNLSEKSAVEEKIKTDMQLYNKYLLYSAIAYKRSLECSPYQWKEEHEYLEKTEKYQEEALDYQQNAARLAKIYNNFDNVTFQIIKANYDYKLENIETKGIVKYFVYDKEKNKIIASFDELANKFIAYYYNSVKGMDYTQFYDVKYEYRDLLEKSLDELIALIK